MGFFSLFLNVYYGFVYEFGDEYVFEYWLQIGYIFFIMIEKWEEDRGDGGRNLLLKHGF